MLPSCCGYRGNKERSQLCGHCVSPLLLRHASACDVGWPRLAIPIKRKVTDTVWECRVSNEYTGIYPGITQSWICYVHG